MKVIRKSLKLEEENEAKQITAVDNLSVLKA
jgi:hypothetical protein